MREREKKRKKGSARSQGNNTATLERLTGYRSNLPKKEIGKIFYDFTIELYTCQKICICYYWTPLRSCAYNTARFVNDE